MAVSMRNLAEKYLFVHNSPFKIAIPFQRENSSTMLNKITSSYLSVISWILVVNATTVILGQYIFSA